MDDVTFAPGCAGVNASDPTLLAQAVAAASRADATVLVLGLDRSIEDEGRDRQSIALPAPQLELAQAVLDAAGGEKKKPAVLVLVAGGSMDLAALKTDARLPAIVFAGYPGQSGGQAIAEVLFGAVSPSGRLSQTFYPAEFTNVVEEADMRMRPDPASQYPGRTYRFYADADASAGGPEPEPVVYPFGHGLSYASFRLRAVECSNGNGNGRGAVEVEGPTGGRVLLTTAGLDAPEEPVLARACVHVLSLGPVTSRYSLLGFLSPPGAGEGGRPLKTLRAFGGATLAPGDAVIAEMAFTEADFSLADAEGQWGLVSGNWTLAMEDVKIAIAV